MGLGDGLILSLSLIPSKISLLGSVLKKGMVGVETVLFLGRVLYLFVTLTLSFCGTVLGELSTLSTSYRQCKSAFCVGVFVFLVLAAAEGVRGARRINRPSKNLV